MKYLEKGLERTGSVRLPIKKPRDRELTNITCKNRLFSKQKRAIGLEGAKASIANVDVGENSK